MQTVTITRQDNQDMMELAARIGTWFTPERYFHNTLRPEIGGRSGVINTIVAVVREWAEKATTDDSATHGAQRETGVAPVDAIADTLIDQVAARVFVTH